MLNTIVSSPELHAKWLNTLSFLENCGARKIAACEHPTLVREEMLKHAAEEFRHAHHLKRQIERVPFSPLHTYALDNMLGNIATLHYLSALDLQASRFLKEQGLSKQRIKEYAYILVTYAIELRAEELYPLYDQALRACGSRVTVKSILMEEKEHLSEMRAEFEKLSSGWSYAEVVCSYEATLYKTWINTIQNSIDHFRELMR